MLLNVNLVQSNLMPGFTKEKLTKDEYNRFLKEWILQFTGLNSDNPYLGRLTKNIINFTNGLHLYQHHYDVVGEEESPIRFIYYCIPYQSGRSITFNIAFRQLFCILHISVTFPYKDSSYVILSISKRCISDKFVSGHIEDMAKKISLNTLDLPQEAKEIGVNLERLLIAKDAIDDLTQRYPDRKSFFDDSDDSIINLYETKIACALYTQLKPEIREQFVVRDRDGKLIAIDKNIKQKVNRDNYISAQNIDIYNKIINSNINHKVVIQDPIMIPVKDLEQVICQYYMDSLMLESYDAYMYMSQHKHSNENTIDKARLLIEKHYNITTRLIDHFVDMNKDFMSQGIADIDKEDFDPDNAFDQIDRMVSELIPDYNIKIGYMDLITFVMLPGEARNEYINRICDMRRNNEDSSLIQRTIRNMTTAIGNINNQMQHLHDTYMEIRSNHQIQDTYKGIYDMYVNYVAPILRALIDTTHGIMALSDCNFNFTEDGE